MRCSASGCTEHTPLRIEPEPGQVSENVSQPVTKEAWHVLQEHVAGSHLANDAGNVGPEPAVIVYAPLVPGHAERLAWETGRDESHLTAKEAAWEGREIVPDRRAIQGLVFHPRHETGRCVGVPLAVTHTAIPWSEGKLESQLKSSNSGT